MTKALLMPVLLIAFFSFYGYPLTTAGSQEPNLIEPAQKLNDRFVEKLSESAHGSKAAIRVIECARAAEEAGKEIGSEDMTIVRKSIDRALRETRSLQERAVLEEIARFAGEKRREAGAPRKLLLNNGTQEVIAPIRIESPTCLACHGTVGKDVAPSVTAALGLEYPQYTLTGYGLGDLIGVWIIISKPN